MAKNWYIILELEFDPNPVHDETVIQNRINEKAKFWSSKSYDFKKGAEYQYYNQMIPVIRRDMIGEFNKRNQLIKEACDITYGPIDKFLKLMKKSEVTIDKLQKLATHLKVSVDVARNRALALGMKIGEAKTANFQVTYDKYYKSKPPNAAAFDGMAPLLKSFNVDNIYEFLFTDTPLKGANYLPCEILRLKAGERKRNEFKGYNNISALGSKLCIHCEMVFKDDSSKIAYDNYLEYTRRKAILDEVRTLADICEELTEEQCANFIRQLTKLFKNRNLAAEVFADFCKVEKIHLSNNRDYSYVFELCDLLEQEITHLHFFDEKAKQLIQSIRNNTHLTGDNESYISNDNYIVLAPVTYAATKSYAVKEMVDGELKCHNLIIKNTPFPQGSFITNKIDFKLIQQLRLKRETVIINTNIKTFMFEIYENDFMEEYFNVNDDYIMGIVSFELPSSLPESSTIEVALTLNSEGILGITARETSSGKEVCAIMKTKREIFNINEIENEIISTKFFGIDFGYTSSYIAYVNDNGIAEVINNAEGTYDTPSVVYFNSPTTVFVGQMAKENAVIDPQNTISHVKYLIGKTDFAINYNSEDKSPEEVTAYILMKLTSDAS